MTIDSAKAAGQSNYQGQTYYFCSTQCKQQFDANPTKYAGAGTSARPEPRANP